MRPPRVQADRVSFNSYLERQLSIYSAFPYRSTVELYPDMPPTKQAPTRQAITLKGSTNLVTEFFKYAANTWVLSRFRGFSFVIHLLCEQHFVSTRGVPRRRLSYGEEIWPDGTRHTGLGTRELS